MSLLYDLLRVHQVFGANTNVGKTILTTALVRASAARQKQVYYLKPVNTGPRQDADDEHIRKHSGRRRDLIDVHCLYRFQDPVSPHRAAKLAQDSDNLISVPSDETFVKSIADFVRKCASQTTRPGGHMYIETAGGVHSPTLSGTTQANAYRPLFLPTILIGDSNLGGISSTISSYESLLLRGYIVDAILLFRDEYYRNWEYLESYFAEQGIHVAAVASPPPLTTDAEEIFVTTEKYYETIVPDDRTGILFDTLRHLDDCHSSRLEQLDSMPRRTLNSIWWPFVQHGLVNDKDVAVIDSASSDFFSIYRADRSSSQSGQSQESRQKSLLRPQFDGSASWWTQALGHAHPSLVSAAARAAGRYGHVMFPQATHLPALQLAEHLLQDGPGRGWASRVFFSDDGSTGMEVALKMALRAYKARYGQGLAPTEIKQLGILGLKGSYHGDTIGAMDACEEGVYTCEWHNAKGYWFEPPTISIRKGQIVLSLPSAISPERDNIVLGTNPKFLSDAYDIPMRLTTALADTYRNYIRRTLENLGKQNGPRIAALVLEPLVLGAGGMIFVDPLFQRVLVDVVRGHSSEHSTTTTGWSGMPVIFDEVFVGLYRVGMQSPAALLGVNPDISVHAKILTGGLVPLAVTLASDSIFKAFFSLTKTDALLHGHSYTAHPIGCEVANETLKVLNVLSTSNSWKEAQSLWTKAVDVVTPRVWSFWDPAFVDQLSHHDDVAEAMTLGTVLAFRVKDKDGGYGSQSAKTMLESIEDIEDSIGGTPFGIHFRTLGDVAYFMTSLNTSPATIRMVENKIRTALQ